MTEPDLAHMGEFLREYTAPRISLNAMLNFVAPQPVYLMTMEVEFPDVSFWQGSIDYGIMSTKTNAIIIRAGQNRWVDTQFQDNYRKAKESGLLVGVYWFYDGRVSPGEQAELLISILRDKKLELEVFLDWEHNYGGAYEGLKNVVAMMQLVEQAGLDIKGVGIYTGYYFFRSNSNPITNFSQYNYLKTKPLWLAWYANSPDSILIPPPWNELTIWQWGTPAWYWGQDTAEIDMNIFNGTKLEFTARYGTGEPQMADYVVLESLSGSNHSIRRPTAYPQTPHILGSSFSSLIAGTTAQVAPTDFYEYASDIFVNGIKRAAQGDKWWKIIVPISGVTTVGWIAERHLGANQLSATFVQEPTTPTLPTLTIEVSDKEGLYIPVTVELKPK